jgi:hypothetical protein
VSDPHSPSSNSWRWQLSGKARRALSTLPLVLSVGVVAGLTGVLISRIGSHISTQTLLVPAAILAIIGLAYRSIKDRHFIHWPQADRKLDLLQWVSLVFLCIGVITSSWNGLRAGAGLALCDVFLVLAALCFVGTILSGRSLFAVAPRWLVIPAYALLVDVLFSALIAGSSLTSMVPGIRFVVALLFTPLVVGLIAGNLGALWLVVDCWLFSAGVNAAVGTSDYFAHTHIGQSLTGATNIGRVPGLTTQPNHLAFVCIFAMPILVARMLQAQSRSLKLAYLSMTVLTILGLLASGSRGGALGGVFVLVSVPFFQPAIRKRAIKIFAIGIAVIGLAGIVIQPNISFISIQRLTGASSALAGVEVANSQRSAARQIAIAQFNSSPLYGVDFSNVREAQNIYLQLLSAGGVIALLAWLGFWIGGIRSSFRFARLPDIAPELRGLAGAICGTLSAWLIMGTVENQLYDRYLFVPCGLFIGCLVVASSRTKVASAMASTGVGDCPRPAVAYMNPPLVS